MADAPIQLGFGNTNPAANVALPSGPSAWERSNARLKREDATTRQDYMGSMWRQDGVADGLVASHAGSSMLPDEKFNPFTDKATEEAKAGINPEFQGYLYQAVSANHQQFIRQRLLSKQEDLQRLDDMGMPGTIGRLAFNFLLPENYITGLGVGAVARGLKTLAVGAQAGTKLAQAEQAAGAVAKTAREASSGKAMAGAVAFGAAENAAIESLRQSVSFENDNTAVIEAGLVGAAFSAPFAWAGARQQARVASAAEAEHRVLSALVDHQNGKTLTKDQGELILAAHSTHKAIVDLEAGRITPDEFNTRVSETYGPFEPPDVWIERYGQRLKAEADSLIQGMGLGGLTEADVAKGRLDSILGDTRRADQAHQQTILQARIDRKLEKARRHTEMLARDAKQKDLEAAFMRPDGVGVEGPRLWDLRTDAPASTSMEEAFRKALKNQEDSSRANAMRGHFQFLTADEAAAQVAGKDAKNAAFERAQKDAEARKKAEEEAMIRARELTRMTQEDPLFGHMDHPPKPAPAPEAPAKAPGLSARVEALHAKVDAIQAEMNALLTKNGRRPGENTAKGKKWLELIKERDALKHEANVAAHEDAMAAIKAAQEPIPEASARAPEAPPAPPPEAPATTPLPGSPESFLNKVVTWTSKSGDEVLEGIPVRVNEHGFLVIEDFDGGTHVVHPKRLDQFNQGTPDGFLPGSIGSGQRQLIANIAHQRTAMSAARLDYFAILNRSEHLGVREMVFAMAKDAIRVDGETAQGWTASEYKKDVVRRISGNFHVALRDAEKEALEAAQVPMFQRGKAKEQFYEWVTRATRGDPAVQAEAGAMYPAVQKASTAMKKAYAEALKEAKQAFVKGADSVPESDLYVNRVWHHDRIREAMAKHGDADVYALIAQAIKTPAHNWDLNKAKSFMDAVRKLEFSDGTTQMHLQGRDMGTLRSELAKHNLTQSEIDTLVDTMFDARAASGGDAGQAGPLKFRFDLDEAASVQLPTGTLRMADLLENDPRVLVDSYMGTMGGHIGLAKVGIDSQATFEAKLKAIQDKALENPGMDGKRLDKELTMLRDIHAHIVGRPMSTADYSSTARMANTLRGFTRSAALGQLGLVAAIEMQKAFAMVGFKAMWQSMPSFSGFITALRQGYVPDHRLARDIMDMTGFGSELAHSYVRSHELEAGYADGFISRAEKAANHASHISDIISGNASFTSMTRNMAAQGATRQAFEHANGKNLSAKMRERWVSQGLDANEIDAVLADLKAHADHTNGRLDGIRYEEWKQNAGDTYDKFRLFINRQAREAIQDQDIGETMPWMHTTLGKMVGELRTFMLVGHAKNFLKNAELRDGTALQVWFMGFMSEALAYSIQTAMNKPHEMDTLLTPEKIASSAAMRMAALGMLPLLTESAFSAVTGKQLLPQGYSASGNDRTLWKTASFNELVRLGNMPSALLGSVGLGSTTQGEFREAFRALPGARLYGLPLLGEQLSSYFPKSEAP